MYLRAGCIIRQAGSWAIHAVLEDVCQVMMLRVFDLWCKATLFLAMWAW